MPSNRPKIVIYTNEETIKKLDMIAEIEKRSRGNMGEMIIDNYIKEYEQKRGKLNSAELSNIKTG